jgi:hypothetical protein
MALNDVADRIVPVFYRSYAVVCELKHAGVMGVPASSGADRLNHGAVVQQPEGLKAASFFGVVQLPFDHFGAKFFSDGLEIVAGPQSDVGVPSSTDVVAVNDEFFERNLGGSHEFCSAPGGCGALHGGTVGKNGRPVNFWSDADFPGFFWYMPINYAELPPINQDPAHDAVVSTLSRLRQTQVEGFLARCTGSHAAAIFLREVLYWLSPSKKAPARPRSTVYRNGAYWMVRTQEEWKELNITRSNLAAIYRRCEDLIEIDHFMYAAQRRTHYRIKFDKLLELMERDETLQACLQCDSSAARYRGPVSTDPRPRFLSRLRAALREEDIVPEELRD